MKSETSLFFTNRQTLYCGAGMKKARQNQPGRFAVPPYWVAGVNLGAAVANCPGEAWERIEKCFAPSPLEVRTILVEMRRELRWPRSMMAAILGVHQQSVRAWESGERTPTGAACRLIWLVDVLLRHPEKLKTATDLLFWGKGQDLKTRAAA